MIGHKLRLPIYAPQAFAGALVIVAAVVAAPYFLSLHAQDLLVQAYLLAIFAIGFDLLWGYAGILSLGHSAFFGLGAYAIAVAATQMEEGLGAATVGVFGGIAAAIALALVVGWIAFYSRTTPIYIAVITLALALILERLASLTGLEAISQYTGGSNGLAFGIVDWTLEQWYWISVATLAVVTLAALVLVRSDFARLLVGIRENEQRLAYLGFRVPRLKLWVFTVSAAIATFAGIAFASFLQFVSPNLLGLEMAVLVLVLVAVGGRGTVLGAIVGAIAIGLIGPNVSAEYPEYWELVLGLLFLLVVVFLPAGLFPAVRRGVALAWERSAGALIRTPRTERAHSEVVAGEGTSPNGPVDGGTRTLARIVDVHKSYGTLQVLRGLSLEMRANEILCIIGPNGAGKSTLINTITDSSDLSHGRLVVNGKDAERKGAAAIVSLGVGRTFQGTSLMEAYSVADSLFVAGLRGRIPSVWRRTTRIPVSSEVAALLRVTGLDHLLDARVQDLSHGLRQALELAMALSLEPSILLLDEPTAGLSREERVAVGRLLRELVARRGLGVVLIEHDLTFVREVTDRVAVLHRGQVQVEGPVDEVVRSMVVRDIYLGTKMS